MTEPVRLHVPAKRYLCAADAEYFGLLSAESVRTLSLQGGPMTAAEVAAFEALPFSRDAVAVRRWDDQAKDPVVTPPRFAHFAPLLAGPCPKLTLFARGDGPPIPPVLACGTAR